MGARRGAPAGFLAGCGGGRNGASRAAPHSLLRARPGDVGAPLLPRRQRAERAPCGGRRSRINKGEAGAVPRRASDFEDSAGPDGCQRTGKDVGRRHLDVTWLGHGCFRLRGRGAAVVTDPYPPAIGLKLSRMDAEVVTISHEHDNHNYTQVVREGAYEIRGPGEYEVAGVSVIGVPTFHDAEKGAKHGRNTVYLIEIDDVRVCHLGDLGHKLDDVEAEVVTSPDVLLVPVGGRSAMNAAQAAEVVRQLEPRYVVPMHYAIPGLKLELDPIDRFLKEMGVAASEPQSWRCRNRPSASTRQRSSSWNQRRK
ncbi:MAG: MBL fold metallo-hydrolase [Chloroflexi bacterium]|nr:MAG: MBL fold metallo-hydrolase [Chloroflexota bacterium]